MTPDERHFGYEHDILARRSELYERARLFHCLENATTILTLTAGIICYSCLRHGP